MRLAGGVTAVIEAAAGGVASSPERGRSHNSDTGWVLVGRICGGGAGGFRRNPNFRARLCRARRRCHTYPALSAARGGGGGGEAKEEATAPDDVSVDRVRCAGTRKVTTVGNSYGVTLPKPVLEEYGMLEDGETDGEAVVYVEPDEGRVVVEIEKPENRREGIRS